MLWLTRIILGIGVMIAAFWGTLALLSDNTAAGIHVVEATFGGNCKDFQVMPPHQNKVAIGNATQAVKGACAEKRDICRFEVEDAMDLSGDPAAGCEKDFSVDWTCGVGGTVRRSRASPPADHKSVLLSC
jgi:hypothetical protein